MCKNFLRDAAVVLCASVSAVPAFAAESLKITIIEGQSSINNLKTHSAREPVVEVRDENGRPVAGASVTFLTPATGPSALFGEDHVYMTQTDARGRAVGRGLRPTDVPGPFEIRVSASSGPVRAAEIIRQVNAGAEEGKSSKKFVWIGVVAGAAAGGILAATHGGGGSAQTAGTPIPTSPTPVTGTGVLAPGGTTFGPPR